ncbi:MAG: glucokinase [Kordiimonadaceae bacterium]|nr:glucokinase [Kordiimonadaceae bacterium]
MINHMIVSDVGGTNGRFAIAEFSNQPENIDGIKLKEIGIFPCKDYNNFNDLLSAYLKGLDCEIPKWARFSIAGEMTESNGNLWHFNWDINARDIEQKFNFEHVTLLNDYEALIRAIPRLDAGELETVTPFDNGLAEAPFSAFGVGSGLGAAIGIRQRATIRTISTEIGHMSFAPKSKIEQDLLSFFANKIKHISTETFLSGPGLIRIYEFLSHKEKNNIAAHEITKKARDGSCEISVKTVSLFLDILASVAGDIALAQGSRGGIYIGGGIIPHITDLIDRDRFIELFTDKGPMSSYVKKIPVHIVMSETASLTGAAINY